MARTRRRALILLGTAAVLLLAGGVGAALWLSRPDAGTLTGYAASGDLAGVRRCLGLGVDPDEPSRWGWRRENPGQTPLTAAAQFGRVDAVRLLLESGADPGLRDGGDESPGATPLATAAIHGQLEVCRILLEAGADPNVPTSERQPGDGGNWTALDWALQGEHTAVADLLREHGAVEGRRGGG